MMTEYRGIDYGLGQSNIDRETGIRYGVISQHLVMPEALDSIEYDYGKPTCPKCGNEVSKYDAEKDSDEFEDSRGYSDYLCETCKYVFDSCETFSDEPLGWTLEDSEYSLADCLQSDIFVFKSPYYTFAQFCSPCVPGAGNLDSPCAEGVKTYCLGHDWFENDKAPYPVYRVSDNSLVNSNLIKI